MDAIPRSEYSEQFLEGMKNRMGFSFYKYGPVADACPHKVNALESLQKRIDKYLETGNTEWLMDVANFAMIEFMHPAHPKAHFRPTEASESPGRFALDDGHTVKDNASLTDEGWKEIQGAMASD